ncbi:MAG: DUF7662 domain-containing protein [Actinomycetota bacterium]
MTATKEQRRSLKYIRLAAHLAAQPAEIVTLVMTLQEIELLVGTTLPSGARFPSWWRNDEHRAHSSAWLSAGWRVEEVSRRPSQVAFVRSA